MSSAAVLQLARELQGKVFLGRTISLEAPRRLSGGSSEIDELLGGGWPRGRLSEISGPISSGKTAVLLATLAEASRRGEVTAYIDVADALHAESFAGTGADLRRVLWVRPPGPREAARCAEMILDAGGFSAVVLDFGVDKPRSLRACVWPRLARAAERSHAALVIAAPYELAGSFASVRLRVRAQRSRWQLGAWPLFDGLQMSATVVKNRYAGSPRR